jgi:DNA-binding response OmpR family regulator
MRQPGILIVEADLLIRSPLAEYLRECGYRVLEASDAAEARQLLKDGSNPVNIVLADADASPESGFALAVWIRSNCPGVRVALAGSVAAAVEKGADLCHDGPALSKPYHHQFVRDHIRRLLATRDRNEARGRKLPLSQ